MKRTLLGAVGLLVGLTIAAPIRAEDGAQVLLLSTPDVDPPVAEVQGLVEEQLESFRVWVELLEREQLPESTAEWVEAARAEARERPGTLALIGWRCGKRRCRLFVVEPRSQAVVELAFPRGESPGQSSAALAAVVRETLLGDLLPELERLVAEGEEPTAPEDIFGPAPTPADRGSSTTAPPREWLWFEGGYQGEYPYPGERALHGPWVGITAAPTRYLIPLLSAGWLGVRRGSNEHGEVLTHRIPIVLGLRLAIPVQRATFALMPAGRLDVVFASTRPTLAVENDERAVDPELHLGGIASWHLPMPAGLEAVISAGVYGTIVSHAYTIESEVALPASRLRLSWSAGIAWSPL